MFFKKIFKKKEQLDTELDNIKQDEKVINKIIDTEELHEKFQKSTEEIVVERNKIIIDRRDKLVDVLVDGVLRKSVEGMRFYSKEIDIMSYEHLYNQYGLCINTIYPSKKDGKSWILSLIDSFENKGYEVKLNEREDCRGAKRGVYILIRW